jgi:hypothetical protein
MVQEMKPQQSKELWRLVDLYRAEAERCREIGAYLAGCVMLGSALEAGLLLMAECQVDNVRASARVPKTNRGAPKPPQKWTLGELLDVGKDMTWLPAAPGQVGDYAWAVQKTRNLVHAGTYVSEHAGVDIGEEDYESTYTVVQAAFDWLDSRICDELSRPEA